jgi:type II secretory pathway pseudopilin PulG
MATGRRERGFTYLAMLLAVAVVGIGLASAGTLWSTTAQREKEAELLFIGDQFRRAIRLYVRNSTDQSTPGAAYPKALQELLDDRRRGDVKRHLRKLYADPMTGKPDWGLVTTGAPDGERIIGVHSLSASRPLKTAGFGAADRDLEGKARYSDWKFTHAPEQAAAPAVRGK